MQSTFEVVNDVKEIAKLNKQLAAHLKKTFQFKERREITYPSGHFNNDVYFEQKVGENVRAWVPHKQPGKLLNLILFGEPGASQWLEIAVQLNFPAETDVSTLFRTQS
jgi:hypothetical protein